MKAKQKIGKTFLCITFITNGSLYFHKLTYTSLNLLQRLCKVSTTCQMQSMRPEKQEQETEREKERRIFLVVNSVLILLFAIFIMISVCLSELCSDCLKLSCAFNKFSLRLLSVLFRFSFPKIAPDSLALPSSQPNGKSYRDRRNVMVK